jgi:hypothetical protein
MGFDLGNDFRLCGGGAVCFADIGIEIIGAVALPVRILIQIKTGGRKLLFGVADRVGPRCGAGTGCEGVCRRLLGDASPP